MVNSIKLYGAVLATLLLAACQTNNINFPTGKLSVSDNDARQSSGLLSLPKGKGPFPAVVLLHTCGGLKDHVMFDWPNFLNGIGYASFAVDTYSSMGASNCTQLNRSERRIAQVKDAYGALDYLAKLPSVDGNRVAVMGFSEGAISIFIEMIPRNIGKDRGTDFKAAIALYGCRGFTVHDKDSIPFMLIVGEKDNFHLSGCQRAGQYYPTINVQVLPDTYHAFDQQTSRGQSDPAGSIMYYSASAVNKSQQLTKEFFSKYVK